MQTGNQKIQQLASVNCAGRQSEARSRTITIPGKIVAKERPRKGRSGRFYTPKKTAEYERLIAFLILSDKQKGKIKKGEKCKVSIRAYFKKKQRMDADNVAKIILDGANKMIYDDDRQVKELNVKIFENQGDERVEFEVERIK